MSLVSAIMPETRRTLPGLDTANIFNSNFGLGLEDLIACFV